MLNEIRGYCHPERNEGSFLLRVNIYGGWYHSSGRSGRDMEPACSEGERTGRDRGPPFVWEDLLRALRLGQSNLRPLENRIEECQMDMSADRTSATRANQLRLWPSSKAHILLCALPRIGLQHTCALCQGFLRLYPAGPAESRRRRFHPRVPRQDRHGFKPPLPRNTVAHPQQQRAFEKSGLACSPEEI